MPAVVSTKQCQRLDAVPQSHDKRKKKHGRFGIFKQQPYQAITPLTPMRFWPRDSAAWPWENLGVIAFWIHCVPWSEPNERHYLASCKERPIWDSVCMYIYIYCVGEMLLDVISQATCQDSTSLHPGLSFDVITGGAEIRRTSLDEIW